MSERIDLVTITFVRYEEPLWGWKYYGKGRRCLSFGRNAIIFELWFLR